MKKAQIQMGETIAVIFVFIILVMFGFIFYGFVAKSGAETKQQELVQLDAIKKAQVISFLPELQCSEDNDVTENCVDLYRIKVAQETITAHTSYYYDDFGFSKITIQEIYPRGELYVLYDREKPNFKNLKAQQAPVQIFDPFTRTYGFGVMNIGVYT
jgi:hypothetical protein